MQKQRAWIDLAFAVTDAGFRGDAAAVMLAIAQPETHRCALLPDAGLVNDPPGSSEYSAGCWQIHDIHLTPGGQLAGWDWARLGVDVGYNAQAAWIVSSYGTRFGPWSTFQAGAHEESLDAAKAALDGVQRIRALRQTVSAQQSALESRTAQLAAQVALADQLQAKIDAARAALA